MNCKRAQPLVLAYLFLVFGPLGGQNPIINDQFSADPAARVFEGRMYVYPSHDIIAKEGQGRPNWFCMEDYHVFSSENLTDWTDHGVILSQANVPWVRPDAFSMWAPDCIERNGKYYFYFPTFPIDSTYGRGFCIGVAVSENPSGPFIPEARPIKGISGIDPNVLIDTDGQAYIYWSARNIYGAKLKDNMLELDSKPIILGELPEKGLKEGPFVFERKGIYYLTYPHVENNTERLEYAVSDNPLGPFTIKGVIMDESRSGCWTNHQSIVEYKDQWYLFYHDMDLSPKFDKNRSVRVDSLFFNDDGSIVKVRPSHRGVGLTDAGEKIQLDRYSEISDQGVLVTFNDTLNTFAGWKTIFSQKNAWLQYNNVDFNKKRYKNILLRTVAENGGIIELHLDKADGPLLAEITIPKSRDWNIIEVKNRKITPGPRHLFVRTKSSENIEVDWISFK